MRRFRLCFILAAMLLLPHLLLADSQTYTAGGCSIDAGFTPDKTEVMVGEPLWVTLNVTNSGGAAFQAMAPTGPREFPADITIVDPTGQIAASPNRVKVFSGFTCSVDVSPGKSMPIQRTLVTSTVGFTETGTYTIICKSLVSLSPLTGQGRGAGGSGINVISSFPIVVDRYDSRQMGQIIGTLGQAALTGSSDDTRSEAVYSLTTINDSRTINWYGKIIKQGNENLIATAVSGLGEYASVDAAKALLPALGSDLTEPDSFVTDALKAMEDRAGANKEKIVEALRLPLLKDLVDPSPAKRALAVAALADTGDSDVLEPMIAALSDPDSKVRDTAALAIGKLGDTDGQTALVAGLSSSDQDFHLACAQGLVALKLPFDPAWVLPVACEYTMQNQVDPIDALQMIVTNGGKAAGAAIASGLHFDDPSPAKPYNFWFLYELDSCPGAPHLSSQWQQDDDPNCPETLVATNRAILAQVKTWLSSLNGS